MTQAIKQNQTVTFRVNEKVIKQLDKLSVLMDRPRSYFLKQGVENILDLYDWQLEKISEGEKQIKQGKFATKTEVDKAFRL
jgi:predicted transcriptional regulator